MIAYYAVAVLTVLLTAVNQLTDKHFRKQPRGHGLQLDAAPRARIGVFDLLSIAVLVFFASARHDVGTDFRLYESLFAAVDPGSLQNTIGNSPQEAGFTTLMWVLRQFTDDAYFLFLTCALITVVPVYITIKTVSANPALAISIYVLFAAYITPFNTVRQGVAVAILFAAHAVWRRNKYAWFAMAALAATFHASAIIAAVGFLLALAWRPKLLSAITAVVGAFVLSGTLLRVPLVASFLGNLNPRYEDYLVGAESGIGSYLLAGAYLGFVIWAITASKKDFSLYSSAVLLAAVFLATGTAAEVLGRMEGYFSIYLCLLVPAILESTRKPALKGVAVVAIGAAFYAAHLVSFGDMLPYQTY